MLKFTIQVTGKDPQSLVVALYELSQRADDSFVDNSGNFHTYGAQGQSVKCEWKLEKVEDDIEGETVH